MSRGANGNGTVDTLGLPISISVTPADMHDTQGARRRLSGLKFFVPRLKNIWADAAYRGQELANWCKAEARLGVGSGGVNPWRPRIRYSPEALDCERTFWLAFAQPKDGQRLRAQGPDQRNVDRGGDDSETFGSAGKQHGRHLLRVPSYLVALLLLGKVAPPQRSLEIQRLRACAERARGAV